MFIEKFFKITRFFTWANIAFTMNLHNNDFECKNISWRDLCYENLLILVRRSSVVTVFWLGSGNNDFKRRTINEHRATFSKI